MKLNLLFLLPLLAAASPVARDADQRLALFGDEEEPVWLSTADLLTEKEKGRNYFDVTDHADRKAWRGWKEAGKKKAGEYREYP